MKQNLKQIVVILLVFISLWYFVWTINTYAKNDKIILSKKYNQKKIDRITNSIKQKNNYRFLINTTDSFEVVESYFLVWDKKAKIKEYSNNKYMIRLSLKSDFLSDNITDINNWILPLNLWIYSIVQPEIVEWFATDFVLWEENDKLWWNNLIQADLFQEELGLKEKIKVWVLDTWIDYTHSDLDWNYNSIISYDFVNEDNDAIDDNWHGTGVAWIIWAEVNGEWRYWVNSNSDLVWLKVLDASWIGTSYDILEAIEYAKLNNIKVLNMSFGWAWDASTSAVCAAIADAKLNGIFTVVSAGNNNTEITNLIPASCSDSITIWSINTLNEKASFSNYWTWVTLYAPWVDIYSTDLNNTYSNISWTSFSAGFVSWLISKELASNNVIDYDTMINNLNIDYNLETHLFNKVDLNIDTLSWELETLIIPEDYIPVLSDELSIDNNLYLTWTLNSQSLDSKVLLLQDYLPWNSNANKEALNKAGVSYDTINSSSFANIDLSQYKSIIIASDQPYWFYNRLRSDKTKIEDFVSKWWLLVFHSWDRWWQSWNSNYILPWGVWSSTTYYNYLVINNKNHPIITWEYNGINISNYSTYFYNWGQSTHWYFYNLYNNTDTIIKYSSLNRWTYIEYEFWKWKVLSTMQTLEYGYRYRNKKEILDNEMKYILNYVNNSNNFSYNNSSENNSSWNASENTPSGENIVWKTTWNDALERNNEGWVITPEENTWDPVNLNTWEFVYDNVLMQYNSKWFPFEFKVNYQNQAYYNGPLWNNFDFNYNQFLIEDTDWNVNFHNGKLGVYEFIKTDAWFEYNKALKARLDLVNWNYSININNNKILNFWENLKLENINDNFWNSMSFIYDENKALVKIIDSNNREYNITHYEHSRIKSITDFNWNKVEFVYFINWETEGNEFDLKTIRMINGYSDKEINFTYTIWDTFESSHNIIKLIDSENNVYVENTYDSEDRVSSQKFGIESIHYTYITDVEWNIIQNSVIDREWNNVIYTYDSSWNTIEKVVVKTSWNSVYSYEYNEDNHITKEILPLGNGYTFKYDLNNNLIEKRQKTDINAVDSIDDIITSFTYDLNFNKPTTIVSPNGTIINFELDLNWNIINKEILWVTDIDWNSQTIIETYEYNISWELIKKTDANWNITNFEYLNWNLVKSIKNPLIPLSGEIATEYSYDSNGNIVSITDPEGNITNLTYNDFNLLNNLTTPEGIVSEYSYNKLNKKVNESIILWDLSKVTSSYEYDILDNPTSITKDIDSTRQKITVTKYDNNSNITEIIDGNNATVQFSYNEESYITSKTVVNWIENIVTNYIYDENNRLIKQINPNLSEVIFTYDLYDRIVKQTLSNEVYTILSYDKSGNITETKTYSSANVLLQEERSVYDKLGRKIKTLNPILNSFPLQEKEATSYFDAVWNIVKIVDSNLWEVNYSYDEFNRLSQVVDKLWNTITNTYNKNDKLVSRTITATDWTNITTSYSYDSDNRLISETNNLNQTTSYTYNNLSQVVSKTDKDWTITTYKYDYVWNVLEETIWTKITKYEYDINSNLVKLTDANNNITLYEYDNLNRLIKQTYPDGNLLTQEYDISWNLIKRTDPNGTVIINNYDNLNRLTSRDIGTWTWVLWATSETYTYDELWRVISWTDNLWNDLSFDYDSLNRLITETNSNELVNYNYDINSNITSINNTNYTYDINNRLQSVKNWTENIANYSYNSLTQLSQTLWNWVTTNYGYDELLRIASLWNYDYTYNTDWNITSDWKDYYSYDELWQITWVNYDEVNVPEYNGDKIERFFYDNLWNRTSQENYTLKDITTETCTDETVVEDVVLPNGKTKTVERKVTNCTTATTQVEKEKNTLNYITNSLNQYTKLQNLNKNDEVKKEFTYEYDNNGNLSKDDINQYFYDYKNRLVKVVQNEVYKVDEDWNIIEITPEETIVEFTYDILWRRIEKRTENKTINYIYAGQNVIKEIVTDNWTNTIIETRENIYSNNLDDILSTIITDYTKETPEINRYFYEKNHLWSITKITDIDWSIVEQYEYDTFWVAYASVNNVEAVTTAGNKKTLSIKKAKWSETSNGWDSDELTIDNIRYKRYNAKWKIGNTRLYTGREYDAELKLYYNRARYYSPDLGRFISRDPIDISDDVNLYGYVGK